MPDVPRRYQLDHALAARLDDRVNYILENCPGQSEYRYLSLIGSEDLNNLPIAGQFRKEVTPLVLQGLPGFEDVQRSKILALLLGETVGRCVAYIDYNGSYLTDVRPTALSRELSSGTGVLEMHNDLAFASDLCRPRILVLLAHRARGDIPATFLAPASMIAERISSGARDILRQPIFEIRAGGKLHWRYQQIRRLAPLCDTDGEISIRLSFGDIKPAAELGEPEAARAGRAISELTTVARQVGAEVGWVLREGEALLIPNDHCLHGRAPFSQAGFERLLLRAYVVPPEIVTYHNNTMIPLSA